MERGVWLVAVHGVATAAKSLQLCPTLCDPRDGSLLGSSVHGICQARLLEWVAISFSNGVAKGPTILNNFTFAFHFHTLEKEMATHFSVLACRIPGTGKPSGLPSLGSHRVGHD